MLSDATILDCIHLKSSLLRLCPSARGQHLHVRALGTRASHVHDIVQCHAYDIVQCHAYDIVQMHDIVHDIN